MRTLIATMALLVAIGGPAAIAQTGGGTSTAVKNQPQPAREAPVGHRLSDPNNAANKEDAALDRKIKSICRGC
jgi:hypothetical protein